MKDDRIKNNVLTRKTLILLDRLQLELDRVKIERITDHSLVRTIEFIKSENEKIRLLINENPRFDWVMIQKEIDRNFKIDSNLQGVYLKLRWGEGDNFVHIDGHIKTVI